MLHCNNPARADRAEARRRHLLDTARKLFIEQGFHQTGVAQLATASGIKVGQIYRDFESKEAIIAAICENDVTAWLDEDRLASAVAGSDLEAIRAWILRFNGQMKPPEECRLMTEIIAEAGRNPRIADLHSAINDRVRASLSSALAALVPGCERTDAVALVANFILAMKAGVMTRRAVDPGMPVGPLSSLIDTLIAQQIDTLTSACAPAEAR